MTIIRRHARAGGVPRLPIGLYAHAPQHAEVFFPELLDYLDVPKSGILDLRAGVVVRRGAAIRARARSCRQPTDSRASTPNGGTSCCRSSGPDGVAWRWRPRYHRRRWQAGVLLDLLGHTPTPAVEAELRRAVAEYTDPRLRLYALLSLLRHDQEVDPASSPRSLPIPKSRKWLFDGLQKLERTRLYPAEYRNQAALAESDLVNWLIHPTELGRAPDEIELVRAIPFDTGTDAGWADYYLFRFRTESAALGGPLRLAGRRVGAVSAEGPADDPGARATRSARSRRGTANRRRSTSTTCAS